MSNSEKAIQILSKTSDGDQLAPEHLRLLEAAVNGILTSVGQEAFDRLYKEVEDGTYLKPWLHNIEHLTKDTDGYVYWKGIRVEHYSFTDYSAEGEAARRLADKCRRLEGLGKPVSINAILFIDEK